MTIIATPGFTSVTAFAPASVANLGPGLYFLGCAVDNLGDHFTLSLSNQVSPGTLTISNISGNNRPLSMAPLHNCAGIAAIEIMKKLKLRSHGLSLSLQKDNIAPSVMGGFVMVRNYEPLDLKRLKFPEESDLYFVLVSLEFEAPTKKMRAAIPKEVTMSYHIWNSSQAGALVAAIMEGDLEALGKALSSDRIVERKRAPLVPGMMEVKEAALGAGAYVCTISGAGPTAVSITDGEERGRKIGEKMVEAFLLGGGLKAKAVVSRLDRVGAQVMSTT